MLSPLRTTIIAFLGLAFLGSTVSADAQCTAPASWFPHETPRDIDFGAPGSPCEFHQWAWDAFLWLTQPTGPGRIQLLDLPTDRDLFAPEEKGPPSLDKAQLQLLARQPLVLSPRVTKRAGTTSLGGIQQAGSRGILVDQDGRAVYYASHVNDAFYQFVRTNRLYLREEYLRWPDAVGFPVRSMELKSSWKIVDDDTNTDGYFSTTALIHPLVCADGGDNCVGKDVQVDTSVVQEAKVVLVGLHVVGVVEDHPEFIWSTFEHIDNAPNLNGKEPTSPDPVSNRDFAFYAAATAAKDCNQSNKDSVRLDVATQTLSPHTHAFRDFAFGGGDSADEADIKGLNDSVHSQLAADSVWKNYRLVGSVWFPSNSLAPGLTGPKIQRLVQGSKRVSNSTIETFTQALSGNPKREQNCFACHDTAADANLPRAKNLNLSHILKDGLIQREQAIESRKRAGLIKAGDRQLNSFADVKELFERFVKENNITIGSAPHFAFWNRMTYEQFVASNMIDYAETPPVPIVDPRNGIPLQILIPGNSADSNLIFSLRGEGPLFNPTTGLIGRMPDPINGMGPFMSDDDIDLIADWIDRNCPDDSVDTRLESRIAAIPPRVVPCGRIETKEWFAWNNQMPPKPDDFHIVGQAKVPNPGVEVMLVPRVPQGTNDKVLLMNLILIQKPGVWPQIVTWMQARYDKVLPSAEYERVDVFCDDKIISSVDVVTVE